MTTLKIFSLEQQLFIQIVVTSGHITTYGLLYLKTGQMSEANRFESMREDMEERLKVMEKSTRILIPIVQ